MSDDDSEDADFNEAEQEPVDEYDDTSLDEESFSSDEGLDDMELEFDTEDKRSFGRVIIHVEGDRNLVVNKMTRVFNKGVMWSRNRDGSISLAAGDIFASKQDMLQVVKDLCIQEGFHLQKIKNEKTRYTQKFAYPGCNKRIHCSVLVDRMT